MGRILIIQTTLIALIRGVLNLNYWFSYILFLIIVGGLIILFIYITRIASNEKFNFNNKIITLIILVIITILIINLNFKNYNFINSFELKINFKFSIIKFFNSNLIFLINIIIIYLLITLIAVVRLTKSMSGPLRQIH